MRRVFVYELMSGGGAAVASPEDRSLLEAGTAMRDAIVSDLLDVPGVVATCAAAPCASPPPGDVRTVAPRPGESPRDFVARQAAAHDLAWVVAPETDGLLEQLARAVAPAAWIGCTPRALRIAASKRATLTALDAHRLPTPHRAAANLGPGRWVVKPDDGAGALHTRVHRDLAAARADLARRAGRGEAATLEPWVEGEALSLSLLAGDGATDVVACNRQHVAVDADGTLAWEGVAPAALDAARDARVPELRMLGAAVARALPGLRGFVGIDLVWHPVDGPVVIEVNPRVTCAYVGLSRRLGRNLAAAVLARHARREASHVAA